MGMGNLSSLKSSSSRGGEPTFRKGRWVPFSRPGVRKLTAIDFRGWRIEVSERSFGITLRRTTYSATLTSDYPPFRQYFPNLRSREAATQIATRWVETWHETNGHLLQEEKLQKMRRQRWGKKLFKIRSIRRRSQK
ncbi:MAG: hypothetical protein R3B96_15645 [Pirellulaceae bacterium]|nr:hypothetical protein [Planctomycetales bacterium]